MTAPRLVTSPPDYRPPLTRFRGFVLADGRRAGLSTGERPMCLAGHQLHTGSGGLLISDTVTTCTWKPAEGQARCGTQLYVARLSFGGSAEYPEQGETVWLAIEVTPAFLAQVKRRPLTFLQKLSILACVLPGADIRLPDGPARV